MPRCWTYGCSGSAVWPAAPARLWWASACRRASAWWLLRSSRPASACPVRSAIDDRLHGIPQGAADTAREGVANAVEAAGGTGPHAPDLLHAAQQSFVDGWRQAMWAGAAVMGVLFVFIAFRGPRNTPSAVA